MMKETKKMKMEMMPDESTPERIYAFSDGVLPLLLQ
jgi:hypothetical protein